MYLKEKPSLQKKYFANGHCPFEGVAGGRPLYIWFGPLLHQVIVLNKLIDSSLTITRAQPGNETVFLKPSSKFRLYSREENVSTSTDTENLDVDFKVFVPLPVLKMSYIDEDLHIRRQLTVELTGNGRMVQYEVLYDKLKNTMTELSSSLTKISINAIPMYKMIAQEPTLTLNVGEKIGTVKPRKQNCCTKCGNLSKGHLGPTGKLCNMNKC